MITEKELEEKKRKRADKFALVFFLVLFFIPVLLYLIGRELPDRVNRLYFSGYVLMAGAIYFSVQAIRRVLVVRKAPILEDMLVKTHTAAVLPQEYLDLTDQVKKSIQSRRYFKRSLARKLIPLLEARKTAFADPRLAKVLESLHESEDKSENKAEESPETLRFWDYLIGFLDRIVGFWDGITGQGMPVRELEKIITSIKEL